MNIEEIRIQGIGGIKELAVQFNSNMNMICGPNGVGKTTILECVAHLFAANSTSIIRRNAQSERGSINGKIQNDGTIYDQEIVINEFDPDRTQNVLGLHSFAKKLLSLKVNRTFSYTPLAAVGKDVEKHDWTTHEEAKLGVDISEVKNWFVNRHLYSAHEGALTDVQIHNYNLAKSAFSVLDPNVSFAHVRASTNEIMVSTPNGEIYYEYLSSGFKSTLSVIFGIIKDIEFRFRDPGVKADEFDGIILIDELELHLHPAWQAGIAKVLSAVFPAAQFITTTHSPHVIQAASPEQIIALANEEGRTYQRQLPGGGFGFQGWTVEEVLTDVMGMSDTRTDEFTSRITKFGEAIDSEDLETAFKISIELDQMLHPQNTLRKLLKLQLASIGGASE